MDPEIFRNQRSFTQKRFATKKEHPAGIDYAQTWSNRRMGNDKIRMDVELFVYIRHCSSSHNASTLSTYGNEHLKFSKEVEQFKKVPAKAKANVAFGFRISASSAPL